MNKRRLIMGLCALVLVTLATWLTQQYQFLLLQVFLSIVAYYFIVLNILANIPWFHQESVKTKFVEPEDISNLKDKALVKENVKGKKRMKESGS